MFVRWRRSLVIIRSFMLRFALIFFIGLALLLLCIALFSPVLDVREIRVARNDPRLDTELIQRSLSPLFGRRLPLVHVDELIPMLRTDITDLHRSAVPDLATVTVRKEYPSTLQVRLTLKPLAYRLSIDSPGQAAPAAPAAGSGADFLTTDGMYVTYTATQAASGSALPLLHIVDWGVKPNPWRPLVSRELLHEVEKAEAALAERYTQTVTNRTIFLRAREYHLKVGGLTLWLDLRSPLDEQLLRYEVFRNTVPAGTAKQYVDLRVEDKIIYK